MFPLLSYPFWSLPWVTLVLPFDAAEFYYGCPQEQVEVNEQSTEGDDGEDNEYWVQYAETMEIMKSVLAKMTKAELQEKCVELGLKKTARNKAELIERILNAEDTGPANEAQSKRETATEMVSSVVLDSVSNFG